jgi:Ca2+-binding RTX toxin-like protein
MCQHSKNLLQGSLNMSLNLTDASGNTWYIDNYGDLKDATKAGYDSYDGTAVSVRVGASTGSLYWSFGVASTSANTQTVTATHAGEALSLTRKTYVGNGFVRVLEIVTNTGTASKDVNFNLSDNVYHDRNTRLLTSSSGDSTYTAADDWFMVDSLSAERAKAVHVVSGGAGSPNSATRTGAYADIFDTSFSFNLAAGQTKVIMHFYALGADQASATAQANAISSMGSTYLAGMTTAELGALANFTKDFTASTTTALPNYGRHLTLTGTSAINGTGNALDNQITGNAAANQLFGQAGNDTLNGGAGNDTMAGGTGNDTYYVDAAGDVVNENANEGIDTVISSISYNISAKPYIENITLTGSVALNATGNTAANKLAGNAGSNSLSGGDGNDTLNGMGGTDTLNGGTGNDVYIVDTTTDTITDASGTDTVQSSVTFSLAALGAIERLTLTGTAAINGTGNALANTVTGNAAANVIDGGSGADTMIGGAGNDTYVVRDSGDVVTETSAGGIDTVNNYVNYALGSYLENLQLMGSGNINGTGNSLNNRITGNAGNNSLVGGLGNDTLNGGASTAGGGDTLNGGGGNDTYIVDSATDVIVDSSGTDTIQSSVSLSLSSYGAIENLVLSGTASINGTGNSLANVITGNSGNNIIDGAGGVDLASYASAGGAVTVSLAIAGAQATGGAGSDTLRNTEGLIGSNYNDTLTGNAAANVLDGGRGNDTLSGGAGDDKLIGGKGNDRLIDANGYDTLNGGEGNDTYVVAGNSGSIDIFDSAGIDTLDASGATAGVTIDLAPGGTSNINGRMVNLSAGGLIDAPLDVLFMQDLSQSFADDVATVKSLVPQVVSTLSGYQSDLRFGLASFIDKGESVYQTNLAMTNSQTALTSALNALVIGSGGDIPEAQIEALMHAAIRTSEVGYRSDSMRVAVVLTDAPFHNAGDTGYVANDGDAVIEAEDYPTLSLLKSKLVASGVIPVFAVTSGNETTYQNLVEYLGFGTVVTLASDSSNLVSVLSQGINEISEARIENAIGTAYNDTLIGNGLANNLAGGAGNDTYYVQGIEDAVVELASGGTDLVVSTGTFTLGANVENLTLSGMDNSNATGNTFANQIVGNAGNNLIDGGGGDDRMSGGRGNDTYVVDSSGDKVVEYANNGMDTVLSSLANYALGAHVENLTLTGTAAINGTGNTLANVILGNSGANRLMGWHGNDTLNGAAGNDTLIGGVGADSLIGGLGNDDYLFARGDGADILTDNDATAGNSDRLIFSGVNHDQLWFRSVGNNLEVSVIGTADKVSITNWNLGTANHVEQIRAANGLNLSDAQVANLVNAMAGFAPPAAGQTSLPTNYHTALDSVIAANWS